jgi:hypothetical protein
MITKLHYHFALLNEYAVHKFSMAGNKSKQGVAKKFQCKSPHLNPPLTEAVHHLDISENISNGLAERLPSEWVPSAALHPKERRQIQRHQTPARNPF